LIAAKETYYAGNKFRSRLEAKWAMAFNGMFMPYAYEPKPYSLGNGLGYLPDFLFTDIDIYAEIKPNENLSGEEMEKIVKFGVDNEYPLILIVGLPTLAKMYSIQRRFVPPWSALCQRAGSKNIAEYFFGELAWRGAVRFGMHPQSAHPAFVYEDQHHEFLSRMDESLGLAFNYDFSDEGDES
jgi:hypothetical protein